jgi:endoglucanase
MIGISRLGRLALAVAIVVGLVGSSAATTVAEPAAAASASKRLPGWLHTSGSSIKTAKNTTYVIKAVAWFGMETSTCSPHGLWDISLNSGLARISAMGFNTIRLPFSSECIGSATTTSIDFAKNPKLAGKTPLQVMDYVVARAKSYGLNVILDRHRPDSAGQSALWYTDAYSEAAWIADWKKLAKRYKKSSNVIGFDLHNEPHGDACWGCGDPATDWHAAATRAGNAVLTVNKKLLIIVEGVERQSTGTAYTWWGGGLAGVAAKPVKLSVAHRVVYSPHDYPSTIYNQSWFTAANYPKNLPGQWDANWGYIDRHGIAPVLVGEFGTKLETRSDKKWLRAMVAYLKKNGMSFAYWSFNPNSGDTGGLVKDDWTTPQAEKLAYLKPLLGRGSTPTVDPTENPTSPTDEPTTTPTSTPTQSPPTTGSTSVTATWVLQSSWQAGYVAEFEVRGGSKDARSWTVTWADSTATGVANSWGLDCSVIPGSSITCTGADWAAKIPAGQSFRVGLQVTAKGAPAAPVTPVVTITE